MDRRKFAVGLGVVATAALIAGTMFACAPQDDGLASTGGDGKEVPSAAPTLAELRVLYPNEFASSMTSKLDENQRDNSHGNMQASIDLPGKRTGGGTIKEVVDWDSPDKTDISISCIACKSSQFYTFYDAMGEAAFDKTNTLTSEDHEALDGKYADCYSCHTYEDGAMVLSPNLPYGNPEIFTTLGNFYRSLNPKEAVCGQCHNVANARNYKKFNVSAADFDPYKYGIDLDGIYKALVEGGIYDVDEKTGIIMLKENHPQIEVFQGSVHQSMGLSCVDCHMNQTTDEEGNAFTSHDASGSVAANREAMKFCLTCHKDQDNIQDTDGMRSFLKERQDKQAARNVEVKAALEEFYDAIVAAVENDNVDEASLQKAKDNYSLADWYLWEQMGNVNDPIDGAQIAHNPTYLPSLLEKANVLIEEGMELLA